MSVFETVVFKDSSSFNELAEDGKRALNSATTKAANLIKTRLKKHIRAFAQNYTGRLAKSYFSEGRGMSKQVLSDSPYSYVHEFGWPAHNIKAQRYVTKAVDSAKPDIKRALDEAAQFHFKGKK